MSPAFHMGVTNLVMENYCHIRSWMNLPTHQSDAGSSPPGLAYIFSRESPTETFPRDPITFLSWWLGFTITETKRIVFRFHYHSQKVIGSLGLYLPLASWLGGVDPLSAEEPVTTKRGKPSTWARTTSCLVPRKMPAMWGWCDSC